ncbi:MAG: gliding motility-associated C-terminal domain-containing protein [Bacteroidales bacterium]|nr:gliding motility-associated C-terminal domain-containing protein [Bacteroidales bacterium]
MGCEAESNHDHGCVDSIVQSIFIEISVGLFVPNAFAPTNPATGVREFRPAGFNLETYTISVFDAWGNLVWFSDKLNSQGQPSEAWDGSYQGKLAKAGTYFWVIDAKFKNGDSWTGMNIDGKEYTKGPVMLVR